MDSAGPDRWRIVLVGGGVLLAVLLAATGVAAVDREALVFAVLVTTGLALTRWRPLLGAGAVGLLALNTAGWMGPAAVSNLRHSGSFEATMLPATLAVAGLVTAAAGLGVLLDRRGRRAPIAAAGVAVSVLVVVGLLAAFARTSAPSPGDIELETHDMAFDRTELRAEAGEVSVRVRNRDLFWHTFTVPELGVDLKVPFGAERATSFSAPPGVYGFICAVPGHPQAGMRGTLTVE